MEINIDLSRLDDVVLKHFKALLFDRKRFLVLRGGSGSGKSIFAVQKFLLRILTGYKTKKIHKILVLMKTASSMRETVHAEFKRMIISWGMKDLVTINKSTMTIEFNNGSQILFMGVDDPEKLKSIVGITSIYIEEASRITLNDFEVVLTRLRGVMNTYAQIVMAFNPVSKLNWLYNYFYANPKKNTTLHKSVLADNYLLNDQDYKDSIEAFKDTNINKYNTYWLGEWGSLEGAVYENFDILDKFPDSFNDVMYGLDFGYNVPSGLVKISEKDDEFYIEEMLYKPKLTNTDLIEQLKNIIPLEERRKKYIYCDCAEPARIEEIKKAGFIAKTAKKSVTDGIDFVRSKKIHLHKNSYNLINEFEGYVYKTDKEGNSLEEPLKIDDHLVDGVRYSMYTHYNKRAKMLMPSLSAYQ